MAAEWDGRLFSRGSEEVIEELRQEFLDELEENLRDLDVSLDATRRGHKLVADLIAEIRKFALPLRGQAANFGVRLLGTIALRFEDYLTNAKGDLSARALKDVQEVFIDTLLDIHSGKIPWDTEAGELVRKLPAKPISFDPATIEVRNIAVLLVMLHNAQTHYVERELQQCGYRVSICRTRSRPCRSLCGRGRTL